MRVLSVLDVIWRDESVWWDPSWYGGLQHISLPSAFMWTPDISIREAISEERQQSGVFVRVNSSGWVSRETVAMVTLRCDLAMMMFPFDTQHCNLTFQSHLHTAEELELCLERSTIAPISTHGEWDLISTLSALQLSQSQAGRHYSRLSFQLVLRRHSLFYVLNLLVPSALVMLVDLAGFCVPVESAERLPFKVTLLLGYTVYLLLATDLLPPFKDQTPMLGGSHTHTHTHTLKHTHTHTHTHMLLLGYTVYLLLATDLLPPFKDQTPMLGVYLVGCLVFLSISLSESALLLALGQPDIHTHTQPSPLHRLAQRLHFRMSPPGGVGEHRDSSRRGLERSFRMLGSCGRGCVMHMLGEELSAVGEELRRLNVRRGERSDALRLMEALDSLCFRLYASALTVFMLSLGLLWTINS
ncbi:hypothetical protein ACEWY4_017368 [Coilia grayii]|uniref:5-hydroxytryptamine receptor 3A-like n=1 Tax=Coilia grayii TaxID=363190 RepID=A0ABD1JGX7_9TELE